MRGKTMISAGRGLAILTLATPSILTAHLGCSEDARSTTSGSTPDGAPAAGDAGADAARFTLDPSTYSRDCSDDADCVIVEGIANCSTCCRYVAVRRGQVEQDETAVRAACQGGGAPPYGGCALGCWAGRAVCYERGCVMVNDASF